MKTLALIAFLTIAAAFSEDKIPTENITSSAVRVKVTLTPEQAAALFAAFKLPEAAAGKIPSGSLYGRPDGSLELRVTFTAPTQ